MQHLTEATTVPPRTRHLPALALVAALALTSAACAGDLSGEAPTTSAAGETTAVTDTVVDGDGGATSPDDDATDAPVVGDQREEFASDQALPPPSVPTGDPIVVVPASPPFEEIRVLDLRRDGDVVTLEFEVVAEDHGRTIGISHDDAFAAFQDTPFGIMELEDVGPAEAGRRDSRHAVSGVALVDRTNSNRHLVLRDREGQCLCTRFPSSLIDTGAVFRHAAQFPAPPADVSSMTIEFPTAASVDSVPIREVG